MWSKLSESDWLGIVLVTGSVSTLALLTWLIRWAVSQIRNDGWRALAWGAAVLVWLAGAAVAAVVALLGFLTAAAGTEMLVEGPHGARRVVTQGMLTDSMNVYRPVSSHLYVFESGVDNGLRLRLEPGRCTISEEQPSESVLHCGDTAIPFS